MSDPEMDGLIVVGVDGSSSADAALRWAAREAHMRAAALKVVIAFRFPFAYVGTGAGAAVAAPAERREAEALLDRALEMAHDDLAGLDVVREVVAGEGPGHALVEASAEAQLLVVGSQGRGGVSGFTLGSVSHYCVGHARCPVVVVPPAKPRQPSLEAPA